MLQPNLKRRSRLVVILITGCSSCRAHAGTATKLCSATPLIRSVPVLPFPWSDAMLPGEYKQVHLYEDGLVALAEQRLAEGSFVGQRLCGWRGDGDRSKVPMPLLQVVERRPHTEEGHTLVLKSVGRVRETAALDDDAAVAAWADRPRRESEGAWREAVCDPRASHLHDECVRQQRRLDALESRGVPPVPAPAPDLRYEWGHESYLPVFEAPVTAHPCPALEMLKRPCDAPRLTLEAPIDALLDQRRDALLRRGMDEAPPRK